MKFSIKDFVSKYDQIRILRKRRVFLEFPAIHLKLFRNCAFSQHFHTRKLDETMVFYAVIGGQYYVSE